MSNTLFRSVAGLGTVTSSTYIVGPLDGLSIRVLGVALVQLLSWVPGVVNCMGQSKRSCVPGHLPIYPARYTQLSGIAPSNRWF